MAVVSTVVVRHGGVVNHECGEVNRVPWACMVLGGVGARSFIYRRQNTAEEDESRKDETARC